MLQGPVIKQTSAVGDCAFNFAGKECIKGMVASARQKGHNSASMSVTGANN